MKKKRGTQAGKRTRRKERGTSRTPECRFSNAGRGGKKGGKVGGTQGRKGGGKWTRGKISRRLPTAGKLARKRTREQKRELEGARGLGGSTKRVLLSAFARVPYSGCPRKGGKKSYLSETNPKKVMGGEERSCSRCAFQRWGGRGGQAKKKHMEKNI